MTDKNTNRRSKLKNPYTFGVPVRGDNFFGRSNELDLIFDTLENVPRGQKQDMVVIGPRRIGKSSLLYRLVEILKSQKNFVPIYMDLQNIKPRKIKTLFYKFVSEIRRGYNQKGKAYSVPEFRILDPNVVEDLQYMVFSDDMTELDDWISSVDAPNLVLLIDEVELLIEFGGRDTLDWLRSLIQKLSNCVFIVAGSETLYTLTQDYGSPFYNIFKTIEIRPLTDEAAKNLIMQPARDVGMVIHAAEVKKVLEQTGNAPYFIQGVAHYIVQELNEQQRRTVTRPDIDKVIRSSTDYFSAQFSYYWGQVNQVQKALLILLASNGDPLSSDQLIEKLPDSDVFLDLRKSKQVSLDTFDNLLQLQILRRTETNLLWFVVPLFGDWILNKANDKEVFDLLGRKTDSQIYDAREWRSMVLESFDSVSELRSFIFEYFPSISAYIDTQGSMATVVTSFIDYLRRREQLGDLEDALKAYNSVQFERVSNRSYTDIAIVTTLQEELDSILKKLPNYQRLVESDWEEGLVYSANLSINESRSKTGSYRIIITRLTNAGTVRAALSTSRIIRFWQPRYIIKLGIAGGNNSEGVQLGDVLVSNSFVDFQSLESQSLGSPSRSNVITADRKLVHFAREYSEHNWDKLIKVKRPASGRPKCHFGLIVSTEKVISNFGESIGNQELPVIGVEMEAAGIAQAALDASNAKNRIGTGFLSILGVSELIFLQEPVDARNWRSYAFDAAASFLVGMLRTGPFNPRIA
jgi:nucleoside phosphorylase